MKIYSWNVNGLRAIAQKGFGEWLEGCGGDIVGLQEVRSLPDQLDAQTRAPAGWWTHFSPAERKGYSGVALYARRAPDEITTSLGAGRYDVEGRVQLARWGELTVANVYFPNGSGPNRDNPRVAFKLAFYRKLYEQLNADKIAGKPILVMGDFNTAPKEIDLARPKENRKTSGFLLEECEEVDRWLRGKWTDTFRHFYPEREGAYSWWSQRFNVRAKNIGWRLDLVLASKGAMPFVKGAFIESGVMGSDHCPVGVEVDEAVVG